MLFSDAYNFVLYICRYRMYQHLIFLKLEGISTNKSIAPEFDTVKASQDLKLM